MLGLLQSLRQRSKYHLIHYSLHIRKDLNKHFSFYSVLLVIWYLTKLWGGKIFRISYFFHLYMHLKNTTFILFQYPNVFPRHICTPPPIISASTKSTRLKITHVCHIRFRPRRKMYMYFKTVWLMHDHELGAWLL